MKLTAPSSPPAESSPVEAPPPPPPAPVATWPRWFALVDGVTAVLVLLLAFLLASFAARNSDVWLHLATGRLIADGTYSFGTDPFSYATAGRYWANHSWLFDYFEYQIFTRFGPAAVVVVKALSLVWAVTLLLRIRRRGHSLWPWLLVTVLALLASAPRFLLAPAMASILALSALMLLLFRGNVLRGSWTLPLLVGGLFALWSNLDEWFFLGPLAIAFLLLGTVIQHLRGSDEPEPADGPLGVPLTTATLAKALGVGVLACMVNPHHIHVWQLPVEVVHSSAMANEPQFQRAVLLAPYQDAYIDQERHASLANKASYALLFVGGGLLLGFGPLRIGLLVLWIGFALLSLRTVAAIPFFAVVSVPVLSCQLNSFTAKLRADALPEGTLRTWLSLSTLGRAVGLLTMTTLLLLAWPGWLHPKPDFDSDTPRVAWGIVADPSMREVAETIQGWRDKGSLTPEERGMLLSTAVGNYCAWFAPSEKVFVNSRFTFHEPELPTYTMLRSNIGTRPDSGTAPNPAAVAETFQKHRVSYVGQFEAGRALARTLPRLLRDESHWTLWHLGSRSAILGWRPSEAGGDPSFAKLRINPVALAFRIKPPAATESDSGVLAPRTLLDDVFPPPAAISPLAESSIIWMDYDLHVRETAGLLQFRLALMNQGHPIDSVILNYQNREHLRTWQDDMLALPILALRAARAAIAASPNHPEGYFALFRVMLNDRLPIDDVERQATSVYALQECLRHVPPPDQPPLKGLSFSPAHIAATLGQSLLINSQIPLANDDAEFAMYVRRNQLPALGQARAAFGLAIQYANAEIASLPGVDIALEKNRDQWVEIQKGIEGELIKLTTQFDEVKRRDPKLAMQYEAAWQFGLIDTALSLIKDANLKQEFGPSWGVIALQQVAAELYLGRAEDAHTHLMVLDEGLKTGEVPSQVLIRTNNGVMPLNLLDGSQRMAYLLARIAGAYSSAVTLLERNHERNQQPLPSWMEHRLPLGTFNIATAMLQAGPLLGNIMSTGEGFQEFANIFRVLQVRRQIDANLYYNRGLLALFMGENARARDLFEKVAPKPLPGWRLPSPPQAGLAARYVEIINAANPTP